MEKTQVIVIGGGNSFLEKKDFYRYLENYDVTKNTIKKEDWKVELTDKLGDNFEVFRLIMPNKQNADYNAWKIWFEKYFKFLTSENIILIGHSLGGMFLAKYFCENKFPKQIKQIHLVAPVFDYGLGKDLGNFSFDNTMLENVSKQSNEIFLYHSTDDSVVPYNHSVEYHQRLENSELISLKNKNHINQEEFPELVENILK